MLYIVSLQQYNQIAQVFQLMFANLRLLGMSIIYYFHFTVYSHIIDTFAALFQECPQTVASFINNNPTEVGTYLAFHFSNSDHSAEYQLSPIKYDFPNRTLCGYAVRISGQKSSQGNRFEFVGNLRVGSLVRRPSL